MRNPSAAVRQFIVLDNVVGNVQAVEKHGVFRSGNEDELNVGFSLRFCFGTFEEIYLKHRWIDILVQLVCVKP
ncbi:hypothetical protein HYW83_05895 [Candidatus Peregrinibacteria bacterium]|nr:hypothetical protein [Candidatus Peregrinibacteria bacterium]